MESCAVVIGIGASMAAGETIRVMRFFAEKGPV